MNGYTYITLEINNENGEVKIMGMKNSLKKNNTQEIIDVYKILNIPTGKKNEYNGYEKVSRYDYSQKSTLDTNTYATI